MFSLPLIASVPFITPQSPRRPISNGSLPCSEIYIASFRTSCRGRLVVRMRCSDQRSLVELSRVNRFGNEGGVERSGSGKVEKDLTTEWASSDFQYTLNRMSKWLVAALFGLVILWKHDAEALWAAMGSVVNAWLSTILKKVLNHERPSALRNDPGMPSTHAQSIFYAAVFAVVSLINAKGINAFTVAFGVIALVCGSYLSWLRVSQRLHTMNQVLVGAAVGSSCSLACFWLWHTFILEAFILSIWVRIFVILGSASLCFAFLLYVIRNWLQDE